VEHFETDGGIVMARRKELLSQEEMRFFYRNYLYMWDELLAISPYKAKEEESAQNENILPAFCTLSRMYADARRMKEDVEYMPNEKDIPSMYLVKKIVNYYNNHIMPVIQTGDFIRSDLKQDYHCGLASHRMMDCFEGIYYGYYYSECQEIHGALIRICKQEEQIRVVMLSGFDFSAQAQVEQAKSVLQYKQYHVWAKNYGHYYYYEGNAVVGDKVLHMNLYGRDASQRVITLVFNVERFMDRCRRFPAGSIFSGAMGCAVSASLSSSLAQPRMYLLGIVSERYIEGFARLKELMESDALREILRIKSAKDGFVTIDAGMNKKWMKLIDRKS